MLFLWFYRLLCNKIVTDIGHVFSNKRQRIEKFPHGVSIRTWVRAEQEAGYVLGNIETKTAMTPRVQSRSVLNTKLEALEMRVHPKNAYTEEILADIPRGERNKNPAEKQYYVLCTSFGLGDYTKKIYVTKKWWYLRPLNSDGTSKHISVHWSNHFKGLYDKKKLPHLVLEISDNHLRNLYSHHILKH